ncbi:UNVERIFIED_CONTAM: hypothetical protein HDU68_011488, partial [Siphonaria sp. JEL0065]
MTNHEHQRCDDCIQAHAAWATTGTFPYQKKQDITVTKRDTLDKKQLTDEQPQNHILQTNATLATFLTPPVSSRLSSRLFIHDSLYNPNYGYFSKNAQIFHIKNDNGFDFAATKDSLDFLNKVGELYEHFEREGDLDETVRQVWHTPTELFKPHYGFALANYIVSNHLASDSVHLPLKVFEVGAGNGMLAKNILDFILERHPDLYKRTEYTIIEISSKLAGKQGERLGLGDAVFAMIGSGTAKTRHQAKIVNQSIFDWDTLVLDPCFVVAMEVIDNFSHDVVRYTQDTATPVQGIVLVDEDGDYQEAFEPLSDPLIKKYLELRQSWTTKNPVVAHH